MSRFLKVLFRLLIAVGVVAVAAGLWKREEVTRLLAVNSLFSEGEIVHNFSNMNAAFRTLPVAKGDTAISVLPVGAEMTLPAGANKWIEDRAVTSLLVLEGGEIRHQSYHLGTDETDRRISWSVAKSYLSALMGIVLSEGAIDSLEDPVTKYAPELTGTAYDGATIRNVLNMASGVTFDEDYLDPNSDINRMGRVLALGGTLDDFTTDLTETFAPAGDTWQYVSIDTHVIGMVIRGATGRNITDLLSEKIISNLGLEQEPYYITDGAGVAFVLGGLNITTRDFARFGLMIEQNGQYGGKQIVPEDWIAASVQPSAPTEPDKIGYGYQWWVPIGAQQGEFMARGVYGQYIYIDQAKDLVIVSTAADRKFKESGVSDANIAMFRKIAEAL